MIYNLKQDVEKTLEYNSSNNLNWTYEFEYDKSGLVINEKMYNSYINWLFIYDYDEYGNLSRIEKYLCKNYINDEKELKEITEYKYEYDDFSNWIQKIETIRNGSYEKLEIQKRLIYYEQGRSRKSLKELSDFRIKKPNFAMGIRYGVNNTFGADIMVSFKNNLTVGIGAMGGLNGNAVGELYSTSIIKWNQFPEDVYEYQFSQGDLAYIIIGYGLSRFPLYFNLTIGQWSNRIIQNRYDEFRILGNNGYYYLSAPFEKKTVIGGIIFYDGFSKEQVNSMHLRPYFGYENFSGFSFGLCLVFD
jgi:hypothetical protein